METWVGFRMRNLSGTKRRKKISFVLYQNDNQKNGRVFL